MSYPAIVVLPDTVRGDYYPPSIDGTSKIRFGPVTFEGIVPPGDLARVEMRFYKRNSPVYRLDSDSGTTPDAPITITNANTWEAEIETIDSFLGEAGIWKWDVAFYPVGSAKPITLYSGKITVQSDV